MFDRTIYLTVQGIDVFRDIIGQVSVFAPIPNLLNGIELRSISWQPLDPNTTAEPITQPSGSRTVNRPTIHNQDDPIGKVSQECSGKYLEIVRADVVPLDIEVKPQAATSWRDADSRYRRKPISSVPTVKDWSLPTWCPSTTDHGLEHKAAFVQKNDATSVSSGFFLYVANPALANAGSQLGPVREPDVRASGNSSPANSRCARPRKDGSEQQNAFRSQPRRGAASIGGYCSRVPAEASVAGVSAFCVAFVRALAACRDAACSEVPLDRLSCKRPSIGQPILEKRRLFERLAGYRVLGRSGRRPAGDVFVILLEFLWVSYMMISTN